MNFPLSLASDLQTFCVGFDDSLYDERKYAKEIADKFGTNHREYAVEPDVIELMPKLIRHFHVCSRL